MALSREVLAVEAYVQATGVQHVVTATLGTYLSPSNPCSPHSPSSLHCAPGTDGQGRAVDLADATPSQPGALLKVFGVFGPVESKLAELICAAAPYCIHNGGRVNGWTLWGPAVMNEHWTHVHVGVALGVFLPAPAPAPPPGVAPMYSPPLGPIAAAWLDAQGHVISAADPDGHVFWGKWWGNVAGKPYWGTRKVALIGARPDGQPGYRITATDGAAYDLPDGLDKL